MNSKQYDFLTAVGPQTPAGEFMRAYWHPVALSSQVAEPDSAPLTTWLLGERLVVFRDSSGQVGVLDDHCLHRGVSLGLGRNEEGGLRCLYHGWKFATDGALLETPNHDSCVYREKKQARAFPVREQSGLIWTYLGPKDREPPFRSFDWDQVPESNRTIFRANCNASYLVLWEGGVDSSHVGMLHTNNIRQSWGAKRRGEVVEPSPWDSLAPTYEVEPTDYGFRYIALREIPGNDSARHGRQTPAMLPNMRIIPGHDNFSIAIIEVPMTDTSTATYQIAYSQSKPIEREWARMFLGFNGDRYDESTGDVAMHWPNDLGQDRNAMSQSWSGFAAIEFEDVAMALSLSDPWDRRNESLVPADIAVFTLRKTLRDAILAHQEKGSAAGSSIADMTAAVAYDRVIKNSEDWRTV